MPVRCGRQVLYSRGALVELLISSSIARYAEFRAVGQLLTPLQGQLQPVPSSRSDVFTTKHVSVVEKRLLMKLLTFCAEFEKHPEEYSGELARMVRVCLGCEDGLLEWPRVGSFWCILNIQHIAFVMRLTHRQ